MDRSRQTLVQQAFDDFFSPAEPKSDSWVLNLFQRTARTVPAYRKLLLENGIDPASITAFEDFQRLPLLDKASYHERHPLPELCRDGTLTGCDMIAVSSGSSGQPTIWSRLIAADFFHIDTALGKRPYALMFLEHGTRRQHITGVTTRPTLDWTVQQARNLAADLRTRMESLRFLLRDRTANTARHSTPSSKPTRCA